MWSLHWTILSIVWQAWTASTARCLRSWYVGGVPPLITSSRMCQGRPWRNSWQVSGFPARYPACLANSSNLEVYSSIRGSFSCSFLSSFLAQFSFVESWNLSRKESKKCSHTMMPLSYAGSRVSRNSPKSRTHSATCSPLIYVRVKVAQVMWDWYAGTAQFKRK